VARSRLLSERDFASAQAFQKALLDETAFQFLLRNQRQVMAVDLTENRNRLPEEMDVQLGQTVLRQVPRSLLATMTKRHMPFGSRAIYTAGRLDQARQAEVRYVAEQIMRLLEVRSPPSASGMDDKNHPFRYRQMFRYLVGGSATMTAPPVGGDWTVIGITNVAPHAATLENPGWPRPFNRAWPRIRAMAAKERLDVQFRYLYGSKEQFRQDYFNETRSAAWVVGKHNPWGVYLRASDYGQRRFVRYSVPVIWIGPLNSLRGPERISHKHRSHRRRADGRKA